MPFAFGHLIGGWLLGKLITLRSSLTKWGWLFLLGGALAPDIDFLLEWTTTYAVHRSVTHSLIGLVLFMSICYVTLRILSEKYNTHASLWTVLFGLGILTHLFLDMFVSPIPLLWPHPFLLQVYAINPVHVMPFAIADMGLGVVWLVWIHIRRGIPF